MRTMRVTLRTACACERTTTIYPEDHGKDIVIPLVRKLGYEDIQEKEIDEIPEDCTKYRRFKYIGMNLYMEDVEG